MSRLPIRVRLTLPFALAMALVLAAIGAFVYVRVGATLLTNVDQRLRAQATEALPHLDDGRPLLDRDSLDSAGIARGDRAGRLGHRLVSRGTAPAARRAGAPAAADGRLGDDVDRRPEGRVAAARRARGRTDACVVVGTRSRARDETLDRLRHEFLLGGPAGAPARDARRLPPRGRRAAAGRGDAPAAAAITASTPGARLPVPAARDEISRLAETLNDMLARLEAAFEHERRFVADASHELRTPLALLRTELELALRRPRSREELEEALRSAAEETDRLTRLAEDLLLIARSTRARSRSGPSRSDGTRAARRASPSGSPARAARARPLRCTSAPATS